MGDSSARDDPLAETRTSPRRVRGTVRQAQATELRIAGFTYEEIAAQVGYAHRRAAQTAVERALKKTIQPPADELRQLELERCDALQAAWWMRAVRGDKEAAKIVLQVMTRRARLAGLDHENLPNINVGPGAGSTVIVRDDGDDIPDDPAVQEQIAAHLRAIEEAIDVEEVGEETPRLSG